jgi:hypothetical protein
MVWTNKRETNCKGHYTRDYRIMASDGVMSGMGISR